ncbi:MAG: efflux transporter outer membrane subunit [Burkholderiales bacterium]|nr:efflux transporter outer membrane subunit [Burkholderiales bacterium]
MNHDPCSSRRLMAVLAAASLAACTAGPDFQRPAGPEVARYTPGTPPTHTTSAATALGEAQRFQVGTQIDARWWQALGSAELDAWIERALAANPSLAAARATLRQAQQLHSARAGSTLYPQVDASLGTQRARVSPSTQGQAGEAREFSLYNAGIGISYRLDLAGGNRRALEALSARTEHRRHELAGAQLSLAARITGAAITRARLAGQIASIETLVQTQDEHLALTRQRVRLGQAAPAEPLALQAQLEQTRASLPALRKQLEQSEHLLAVLAGEPPGAAQVPAFTLDRFRLPTDLPLLLPSELVRRRPDILAAEALVHTANAEYGVAVARLYPQLSLSASLSSQALSSAALFGGGSAVWALVGQLTQALFNPGLPAEKRASLAALDAAAANYQVVVLGALQEVADSLRALSHDAEALASLAAADAASQASLASVQRQHALGAASYVQLLVARQQAEQSRTGLIAAQAQRLVDSAALWQALGG